MAEIKGKFITLACSLLETKPEAKTKALGAVKTATGKEYNQLDPEGWYKTSILESVFKAIESVTPTIIASASIKLIGRNVYPTIDKTRGLPKTLKIPLDFFKYEAESFKIDHRGGDVIPRKIIQASDGKVVIEAKSPGYNCLLIEGVYLGILEMCGIRNGKVRQEKCVKKGDPTCIYHITWNPVP
jgi:hypothetical protein